MRVVKSVRELSFLFFIFILVFLAKTSTPAFAQEENLEVFRSWVEWSDGKHMLIHYLNREAFDCLNQRKREVAILSTKIGWKKRQEKVKIILNEIIGPFPEKTPLNPQVTGIVQKDGFRIEKVVFESLPKFYVTGCLFIPDGITGKSPAILNVIGHTGIAFRGKGYQRLIYNLVKKGFIVFAIDPIGQGERLQYYDPEKKKSIIGRPTSEHSYVGCQCFISGVSLARYFTWDGIRAVDYLLTRPEVDPERIGITGISGGGTQTSYIWAMDDRLKAAAPTCYITGFRRLLESIGPQDAEQNLYHGVANGITHADYLEVQAPKPAMIVSTTRDFFSIQGAIETFGEVRQAYRAFDREENIKMAVDDFEHGYTRKTREAIYSFFQKTLDLPGDSADTEVEILDPEELHATETGQLSTSLGGETAFSLNKKETLVLLENLQSSRKNTESHLELVRQKARELSGYEAPPGAGAIVRRGTYQRDGYSVSMFALETVDKYVIPLLVFAPESEGKHPAVIYLHPEGKATDVAPGGEIEKLVKQGFIVVAPDVIGTGETEDKSRSTAFAAMLAGKSIPGVQAGDIVRVAKFARWLSRGQVSALAFDELCPALLHAAAFDKSIEKIALVGSPVSYRSIVMNRFYEWSFSCAVAGALTAYDLPDLAACVAPRKLLLIEPKDQVKDTAPEELISREFEFPRLVYKNTNAAQYLKIIPVKPENCMEVIAGWLE
jgi:dienelactone hydrolase